MTQTVDVSATSALDAVVWVFAGMTILVVLVFGVTMWLAIRHRHQRQEAPEYLNDAPHWVADPAGLLDNLTVGDLVGDPRLRQAVLEQRSRLADLVATRDATDTRPSASPDPEPPTPP